MRDTASDWAERLYERLPAVYRDRDLELARLRSPAGDDAEALTRAPLRALLGSMATQVAAVRQDLDALWDDFFLETADDWVVPYLGSLLGANLPVSPVGLDSRLYLRSLVRWRRSKGTCSMFTSLGTAITGRPTTFVEFFHRLGWTQNVNAVSLDRRLTADVRDPYPLSRIGRGDDVLAHTVEVSAPGRYQPRNVGFYVPPLETFARHGVTPAAAAPPDTTPVMLPPPTVREYAFDPLHRQLPLYSARTGGPITLPQLRREPARFAGESGDVVVRRHGVALAMVPAPKPGRPASADDFDFGAAQGGIALEPTAGLLLVGDVPADAVVVQAVWDADGAPTQLGTLTIAGSGAVPVYQAGNAAPAGPGRLVLELSASAPAHFPATVLAVRDDRPPRAVTANGQPLPWSAYANALLVYLPELFLWPQTTVALIVGDDGATHTTQPGVTPLQRAGVARAAEGQIWPPVSVLRPSTTPARLRRGLHRRVGLRVADPERLSGATGLSIEASLVTAAGRVVLGTMAGEPLAYAASDDDRHDRTPVDQPALLALRLAAGATAIVTPQCELVVTDRSGRSLLAYLPETSLAGGCDAWLVLADDGSTYSLTAAPTVASDTTLLPAEADLARAGAGQVLPLEGAYPLRRRVLVAGEPGSGELGVDPEQGTFELATDDPLLALAPPDRDLTVDYVEGFAGPVGARGTAGDARPATRVVAASGDAVAEVPFWRIHSTMADAIANAVDGDVIEVADAATYVETISVDLSEPGRVTELTVRAHARPCLVGEVVAAGGAAATGRFELAGLLVRGAVGITGSIDALSLTACTVEPGAGAVSLSCATGAAARVCRIARCSAGAIRAEGALALLEVTDSIVGAGSDGLSIELPAGRLALRRATVLGRVTCGSLDGDGSLLVDIVHVADPTTGSLRFSRFQRFSRFEPGTASRLPAQVIRCVPPDVGPSSEEALPVFVSLRPHDPSYAQLSERSSSLVLTASETADVVGAFASTHPGGRLANLDAQLEEFLPAGLDPLLLAGDRS